MKEIENQFKEGDIVVAIKFPSIKLEIRRYIDRIYYCKIKEHPELKELVYYERELQVDKT